MVEAAGRRATGRVRDVSTSGAFVESDAKLAVGQKVAVLSLDDDERRPAEVARVADRGLGLRFLAHNDDVPSDAPLFILTDDDDGAEEEPEARRDLATSNTALAEENGALKRQVMALQARLSMRWTTEEALVKRISVLEDLLRRAMIDGW